MADLSFTYSHEQEKSFEVGELVEVICDHENLEGERIRGWLKGVVVQVDPKIVAVQFNEKVYLTDGWMVPDHVLWCPHNSESIRYARKAKRRPRD